MEQQEQIEVASQEEQNVTLDPNSLGERLWLIFCDSNSTLEERLAVIEILHNSKGGIGMPVQEKYLGKEVAAEFRAAKQWLKGYIANRKN